MVLAVAMPFMHLGRGEQDLETAEPIDEQPQVWSCAIDETRARALQRVPLPRRPRRAAT